MKEKKMKKKRDKRRRSKRAGEERRWGRYRHCSVLVWQYIEMIPMMLSLPAV